MFPSLDQRPMETKERLMLKYALGGIVLSTSLHSAALSLGGYTGQAIIGRPLDMSVRSNAPLADIESAGCLLAQVQYGDTVLPAGSVSLSVQAAEGGAVIRVRSNVPVNEPVVSVVLNTGCAADRFSRKYTLLADLDPSLAPTPAPAPPPLVVLAAPPAATPPAPPSFSTPAPALPPAAVLPPAAPREAAPRPPVARPAAAAPAPAARATPAPKPAPKPRAKAKPAPAAKDNTPPAPAPAPTAAALPGGPRLKLDPIDLSPGRNPGLKLNTELSTPPGNEAERKAASELWAALNTPPDKAAEDARRLAAMENDLKALREQQAAMQASVAALTAQLQAEREERAPKSLMYALGVALALAAAALAWLLSERRKLRRSPAAGEQPWWQSGQDASVLPVSAAPNTPPPVVAAALAPVVDDPMGSGALEVSEATESSFAQLHDDHPVTVEALLDLMQQVEFFESLRQQADATTLLNHFIAEYPGACALPYLLLFKQAHGQGDATRLAELGRQYQQAFGLPAPQPGDYVGQAGGLDTQTKLMDVLSRFWGKDEVLGLLKNSLLAPPGTGLLEQHSLAAYQDTLLLYTVAHTLLHDADLHPPVRAAAPAPVVEAATWSVPVAGATSPVPAAPIAPSAPAGGGVDIDLSFTGSDPLPGAAAPTAPAAPADESGRRELPMLDFDLFAIDPKDGKKTDKP